MLDARYSHLYFYQSLNRLQRGLSAIAELLVTTIIICVVVLVILVLLFGLFSLSLWRNKDVYYDITPYNYPDETATFYGPLRMSSHTTTPIGRLQYWWMRYVIEKVVPPWYRVANTIKMRIKQCKQRKDIGQSRCVSFYWRAYNSFTASSCNDLSVCPSFCLSVKRMHCDKTK